MSHIRYIRYAESIMYRMVRNCLSIQRLNFRYVPDLRHDLELSENRRKKLKKDLVKLEKRLDETPRFIPIYDPVLREKDRRYQQEMGSVK